MPAFIETQFPIARLSAESYKERKAGASQTLTGLGKWWGRKPLILVRAAVVGMLMPSSSNPKRDREIFLKILTMDDDGSWERCKPAIRRKTTRAAFDLKPYAERIEDCERPENIKGPTASAWEEINAHLSTSASSLDELIEELGQRTFGHTPRVGDCFCGGGSIAFEAARIGCEAFGSDLNPVAGLLTWASLNLLGGGPEVQEEVRRVQEEVFAAVDRQITEWRIEHNDRGERAEAFLYCVEVKPEGCDYFIPLAPSWVISEKYRIVAKWARRPGSDRFYPEVVEVSEQELKLYKEKKGATVIDSRVIDPLDTTRSWSIEALRGVDGLRRWTNEDIVPRPGDVFQERLYCIRWIDSEGKRRYAAPDQTDLAREEKALQLLRERFADLQNQGFIPSKAIPESGVETDRLFRERGWTHWHHLFTPRQLLMHGSLLKESSLRSSNPKIGSYSLLTVGYTCDNSSRLCGWNPHHSKGPGNTRNVFSNQALNTLVNFGTKSFLDIQFQVFGESTICQRLPRKSKIIVSDARDINQICDIWITDPPYADAVNYHELGDFFLAWYDKQIAKFFPEWIPDSRAELAVKGDGEDFRRSMVEIYRNLARHMPDNGMQMVMFTHQNPAVWADLGMILWASGLQATAAWTISTETEAAGLKKGSYVQGTVCLVLRKRQGRSDGDIADITAMVEDEVKRQIASMQALDEEGEPNFNDADYNLAAYASALKVLTQFASLNGQDVEHEVFAVRPKTEKSEFQKVIERALGIACEILVPRGLESTWRNLEQVERYYLRALDIESRGERRKGMYEELARGFGVTDIKPLLKADKANGARMFTASGFGKTLLGANSGTPARGRRATSQHDFANTPLRHLLFAVKETAASAETSPESGRQYLRDAFGTAYWGHRERFVKLLDWLALLGNTSDMPDWARDSEAARILAGRLRNDEA
jgi:adenine-specific DNA methylase